MKNWLHFMLLGEPHLPVVQEDYVTWLEEINQENVASQVYTFLKDNDLLKDTPTFFNERLRSSFDQTLFTNLFFKKQMSEIINVLDNHMIHVIPLKGVHFSEKYFGSLGARSTSDLDLLIQLDDLPKTIEVMTNLGFTKEQPESDNDFHIIFTKPIHGYSQKLMVEIHWQVIKTSTSSLVINEFWQEATQLGDYKYVKELSDYHTFYMICLHGWRHNLDSMKYFLDIIQLIHVLKDRLDYTRLLEDARRHQTWRRVTRTLSIIYQEYPYLQDVVPFSIKRKTLWEYEAFHSDRRPSLKHYLDYLDYQLLSYDRPRHILRELKELLQSAWQTKKGQSASS